MFFKVMVSALAMICLLADSAKALTKAEALACAETGMKRFFSGDNVAEMIDVSFMMSRERMSGSPQTAARLLNERAQENRGHYRADTVTIVGQPRESDRYAPYFLADGNVKVKKRFSTKQATPLDDGNVSTIGSLSGFITSLTAPLALSAPRKSSR